MAIDQLHPSIKYKALPHMYHLLRNLIHDTDELIYETRTDSQTQRTDLRLPSRNGLRWSERLGLADVSYYIQNG